MTLSREKIGKILTKWQKAWNRHDLDAVMELFHDEVVFQNWAGLEIKGKRALHRAWTSWFANHCGFRFIDEDVFIDETQQKLAYRWQLEWPSLEKGYEGRLERRRGLDIVHFREGKIILKLTYSKTTVQIDGQTVPLLAQMPFLESH